MHETATGYLKVYQNYKYIGPLALLKIFIYQIVVISSTPISDKEIISPYNITATSRRQLMRIKKISVRDYQLSKYHILRSNITRIVQQTVSKISKQISGKKRVNILYKACRGTWHISLSFFFALNHKLSSPCQDSSVSQTQIKKATEYSITFVFSRGNDKIKILLAKREVSWS